MQQEVAVLGREGWLRRAATVRGACLSIKSLIQCCRVPSALDPWGCRRLIQRHSHPQGSRSQRAPYPAKGADGVDEEAGVGGVTHVGTRVWGGRGRAGQWQLPGARAPASVSRQQELGTRTWRRHRAELPNWLLTSTGERTGWEGVREKPTSTHAWVLPSCTDGCWPCPGWQSWAHA